MNVHEFQGFSPSTLTFLTELADNNNREWFNANKQRYETLVQAPALAFIQSLAPELARTFPYIVANASKSGGSLMRVYRDTRFSSDKTPYKTNIGIYFKNVAGQGVHAPGLYLHIDPKECFLGAGIWHPDAPALAKIRAAIDEDPEGWLAIRDAPSFRSVFELAGESLRAVPRGFARDHPAAEDLRRKDFIGSRTLEPKAIESPGFVYEVAESFAASRDLMGFLNRALGMPA